MQNVKTVKTSDKPKQARSRNQLKDFLTHSKLVEQGLMTSHEYEQMYYKKSRSRLA